MSAKDVSEKLKEATADLNAAFEAARTYLREQEAEARKAAYEQSERERKEGTVDVTGRLDN